MQRVTIIIPRRGINDDNLGKKHALRKLISAATTEYVWLTDDDVVLPDVTEQQLLNAICDADMLILPLRMVEPPLPLARSAFWGKGAGGIGAALQIAEYTVIQALTIWSAQIGHPVMCSGANLLVRRDTWLELCGELHPEIPSGDDMFLLEAMKRHHKKIKTVKKLHTGSDPVCSFCAQVEAKETLSAFFRQRMRWAGKAPKYTDRDILVCGATVAVLEFLQILCPLLVLLYWPFVLWLVRRYDSHVSAWTLLLLGIIYPYYMFICLIGGMLHQKRW